MLGLGWVQLIIQPKESKMHKQEENRVCVCVCVYNSIESIQGNIIVSSL